MRRKGFTLIELLAVIVVLAIILTIAVPSISGIIKSASKSSFSSDAKLVLSAVRLKKLNNEDFNALEINKGNFNNLLNLSDANYSSVSFELDEDKLYVRLVGQGKWEGLIACGVYTNIKVVDASEICGLDKQAPIVTYSINGTTDYIQSSNVRIDISDEEIDPTSLKYVWKTTDTISNDEEYINTFSSGSSIDMPSGSGIYYLHIYAKDMSGNIARVFRTFKLDNEAPVITVNGNIDVTIRQGTVYSDAGASGTDNIDGDITDNIVVTGIVNPSVRGTYTITYTVTDSAGNTATTTRTVNVVDNQAPVVTILGNNPVSVNAGSSYTDAGSTAIDDVDGDVTAKISTTGTVNPNVVGVYTITYSVSDNAGNVATATRTVNVIDTTNPTVSFGTNGNTTWTKSNSTTVTVSDAHTGVNTSNLKYQWTTNTTAPSEVSFSTLFTNGGTISTSAGVTGTYYLWILAKDNAGNTIITRTNVFNIDNTAPVITRNGASPITIAQNSTYTDAGATATDAHSGIAGNVTVSGTVNTSIVGTYTITYSVSDNAGNAAVQVTRTINVIQTIYNYAYTGAQQTFNAPYAGTYKLEVWGAQGVTSGGAGGKGGYSTGNVTLTTNEALYVYVGGQSSWNGGNTGGGDGTDIRRSGTATGNRIIVAGGGGTGRLVQITYYGYGGVYMQANIDGGYGGGTAGGSIGVYGGYVAGTTGGTQTSGYALWQGGAEGGGGGYYGGTGGYGASNGGCGCAPTGQCGCGGYAWNANAGAGGSGYIGGVTGGSMIEGNTTMPAPGGGSEIGHSGTGYVRITYLL